jgi:hypothetical protein
MEKIQIKKRGFKSGGVEKWEKITALKVTSSKVQKLKVI